MFGSKNKKGAKKQVGINVKTMDSDLKGDGGKKMAVEYESLHSDENAKITAETVKPTEQKEMKEETSFKAPFNQNQPVKSNVHNQNIGKTNIPQGTFSTTTEEKEVQLAKKPIAENVNNSFSLTNDKLKSTNPSDLPMTKSKETPFLHTATDKQEDDKINQPQAKNTSSKIAKKSSTSSIIWVISFILLLATILLGGYYFYMKSSNKKTEEQKDIAKNDVKRPEDKIKQKDTTADNKNVKENNDEKATTKKEAMTIDKFNTTEATFNNDLKEFVSKLKTSNKNVELKNGIFVAPMINETTPFTAESLLKATHLTEVFDVNSLKPACKLFISSDNNKLVRVGLIFELQDTVDSKLIKDKIIKNEQILPTKMQYLFVDGEKPTIPAVIKFSINPDNYNSRYFNYLPPKVSSSVDWNILDLGKGEIVYFATSKGLAEKITEYFMRLVIK